MLSRRRLSIPFVIRSWSSSFPPVSSHIHEDLKPINGQAIGAPSTSDVSGKTNSLQGLLLKRATNETFKVQPNPYNKHIDPKTPASRFSAPIQAQEYVKVLMELTLQSRLDPDFNKIIFTANVLTPTELSTLVQGLLISSRLVEKLIHVAPGTRGTEVIFNLYLIYIQTVGDRRLTPLQLNDLNRFVTFFIETSQLRKAQTVLDFILASYDNQIPSDVTTTIHYLQLRCGALPENWPAQPKAGMMHNYSSRSKYKAFDRKFVPALIGLLNSPTGEWSLRINDSLEAAIVYSLGFMGQLPVLEKYINQRWGISLNSPREPKIVETLSTPSSEILVSILTSFGRNGRIVPALELMDLFIEKYPELNLDTPFWERLFHLCTSMWDAKIDPMGQLSNGSWEVMKEWHYKRGTKVRADYTVLKDRLTVLRATNNYRGAADVITQCFSQLHQEDLQSTEMMAIVQKYFKLVLKNQAASGCYHQSLRLIKNASPSQELAKSFREYFNLHRQKYVQRTQKRSEAAQQKSKAFDEDEEEDMLLGRLW
ncbi:Aep2p LALA0_S03e00320g [Lachancea lanzarotensis]|uniref:ATPase expression protein 2, mitochondrial n=1 Tax=Lachancea lanzarotensis TaxID=1245769 RepID=A0A0C7N057_9SACH|nr:uncharacterized protein LALA0_S03e00320g [Lachancea lanzarotensis]CEP61324.1 LALA0S03e00320g1_1 [Lachancea lanzarotensis]